MVRHRIAMCLGWVGAEAWGLLAVIGEWGECEEELVEIVLRVVEADSAGGGWRPTG